MSEGRKEGGREWMKRERERGREWDKEAEDLQYEGGFCCYSPVLLIRK